MPRSHTDFCLTHRQERAMGFPGNGALAVLPRMLLGTASSDGDMFKYAVTWVVLGYRQTLELGSAGQDKGKNGSFLC